MCCLTSDLPGLQGRWGASVINAMLKLKHLVLCRKVEVKMSHTGRIKASPHKLTQDMFIIGIVIVFGLVVPVEDTQRKIDVSATLFLHKCMQFCLKHKFHNLICCQWNKGVPSLFLQGSVRVIRAIAIAPLDRSTRSLLAQTR